MTVSIMITTKNRVEDLKRTCGVLQGLSPAPLEIMVTADGCTDGTVEFVRSEVPTARLFINETGKGSIASRVHMMKEARGDLVFALDDDSYPEQMDCLARFTPIFEDNPKIAVLHFPQHTDEFPETLAQTNFGPPQPTRSFPNSGAVLRRSTYLQLPGFEPFFFHAYEEPDYAIQCVGSGYEIQLNPVITIRHHFSGTNRNEIRTHHRHARNEFWSTLLRCPFPQLLLMIAYRGFSQFRYAGKRGPDWIIREPIWWWQVLAGIPYCLGKRRVVSWAAYKQWLRLP